MYIFKLKYKYCGKYSNISSSYIRITIVKTTQYNSNTLLSHFPFQLTFIKLILRLLKSSYIVYLENKIRD